MSVSLMVQTTYKVDLAIHSQNRKKDKKQVVIEVSTFSKRWKQED